MELPNGYKMKTTFWQDFSIADRFGEDAITDTFERAFKEWKSSIEYMTELAIALNYKIWQHFENGNKRFAEVYDEYWRYTDEYIMENFNDEDVQYYLKITD